MYAMVKWEVTTLTNKVGFYVKTCTVEDIAPSASTGIKIVNEACYAKVVSAKLTSDKFVWEESMMTYNSFSYDTSFENTQRLVCEIEFCVMDDGKADCSVGTTCAGPTGTDCSRTCPTKTDMPGYDYTQKGL